MPISRQSEQGLCGLACIAIVSEAVGKGLNLQQLKQRYPSSAGGMTLRDLISVGDEIGFQCHALRAEPNDLVHISLPAILHWNFNHYVVLTKANKKGFWVEDPAIGRQFLTRDTLSDHFTGIAIEVEPRAHLAPIEKPTKLKITQLWSSQRGIARSLMQLGLLTLFVQILSIGFPLLFQVGMDSLVPLEDIGLIVAVGLGFGVLSILVAITEGMRDWASLLFGQSILKQTIGNLVDHLVRLPLNFFEKRSLGDIMSRMESVDTLRLTLTNVAINAILDGIFGISVFAIMLIYDYRLALVVFLGSALFFILNWLSFRQLRQTEEDILVTGAIERTHLFETIQSVRAVKIFGAEQERTATWRSRFSAVVNANISNGKIELLLNAAGNLLTRLQTIFVLCLGCLLVMAGDLTIGMLFAFYAYQQMISLRLQQLVKQITELRLVGVHLERISDVAFERPETPPGPTTFVLSDIPSIEMNNISFRYAHNLPDVLSGVSLRIDPGEYVAFVGPSGGGKTTLVKLLLGLHAPTEGELLVGGRSHEYLNLNEWRKKTGVIMQDDVLMSGTIAENISFFDPDMDLDRIQAAAERAQLTDEIAALPMDFQTQVSPFGGALSGGQRQRLLLARAFYRDPAVMILDEGTANLDPENEQQIAQTISNETITRIVVAHRPALVSAADRVYEVRNGSIRDISDQYKEGLRGKMSIV